MRQVAPTPALVLAGAVTILVHLLLGASAWAGSGGPDAYGYVWVDSDEPDGPPYQEAPFDGAPQQASPAGAWLSPPDQPIGFDFPFYGVSYDTVQISEDGWVSFLTQTDSYPQSSPIPNASRPPGAFVAPLWQDLNVDTVQWGPILGGDGFKVTWSGERLCFTAAGPVDFSVSLLRNGRIRFHWTTVGSTGPDNACTVIGIEDETETRGIELLRWGFPHPQLALRDSYTVDFIPPSLLECGAAVPIGCGDTLSEGPPPIPPDPGASNYCGIGGYEAAERVFRLDVDRPLEIDAALSGLGGRNLDLFLLGACDEHTCVDGGADALDFDVPGPGSYYLAVDGLDPADEGPFDLSVQCTDHFSAYACGDLLQEATAGAPNRAGAHDCAPPGRQFDGGERTYRICLADPQTLRLGLDTAADLDLVLYGESVTPDDCLAWGDGSLTLYGADAGCYHLFVDGPAGAGGDFELQSSCGSVLDCSASPQLLCGQSISGDTGVDGTSLLRDYPCSPEDYSGPESLLSFTNPKQQNVSLVLEAGAPELDLLMLSQCDEGFCFRAADETLSVGDLDAGSYPLLVDGRDGLAGPFTITAYCGESLEPESLEVTLRAGETTSEDKVAFLTPDIPQADIMFAHDLTGSMGAELSNMQENAKAVIDNLTLIVNDLAFGLISFEDYPESYSGAANCNYADTYGAVGDSPYRLQLPVQKDIGDFEDAVNRMRLGSGMDGPESYTRVLWESARDPNIGWRPGSRRFLVMFGDNIPHDCNVDRCLGGARNSGWDPGRDRTVGTSDDIALLDAIDDMAAPGSDIVLLYFDSSGGAETALWDCLARRTGGFATRLNTDGSVPSGIELPELIFDAISEEGSRCETLTLSASEGFEDWLQSVTPPGLTDVELPTGIDFALVLGPPAGTPPGTYTFTVDLLCEGVVVASQQVTIHVGTCSLSAVVPPDIQACEGRPLELNGSGSTATGCAGWVGYQWSRDGSVIRPWDPDPVATDQIPGTAARYTLEVACFDDPSCPGTSSASLDVGVLPDPLPEPLGATLRVRKTPPEDVTITWDASGGDPTLLSSYQVLVLDAEDTYPPTPVAVEAAPLLGETDPATGELLHPGAQASPCDAGGGTRPCRLLFYKARGTSPCSGSPGSACDGFPAQVPCP